jgi:prepilin signal peptidase PulO-like enzyme (type II secretory pathway)
MMLDRAMAALALAFFLAFVGIVVFRVGRVDLGAAFGICLLLVLYDLWTQLFPKRR